MLVLIFMNDLHSKQKSLTSKRNDISSVLTANSRGCGTIVTRILARDWRISGSDVILHIRIISSRPFPVIILSWVEGYSKTEASARDRFSIQTRISCHCSNLWGSFAGSGWGCMDMTIEDNRTIWRTKAIHPPLFATRDYTREKINGMIKENKY